jgi:hypothetical protein
MVCGWYLYWRYICHLDFERKYRYRTYNPALKSIKNTPKATNPLDKSAAEAMMVNASPPRKTNPGKLRVKAENLNLIILSSQLFVEELYYE